VSHFVFGNPEGLVNWKGENFFVQKKLDIHVSFSGFYCQESTFSRNDNCMFDEIDIDRAAGFKDPDDFFINGSNNGVFSREMMIRARNLTTM